MSIASQIGRIAGNVSAAFTAVRGKGGTVSQTNSDHLATAIGTIPDPVTEAITVTANGTYHPGPGIDGFDEVEVDVPDTPLPTLTSPAAAADILAGKEAIDGDGDKLTGSLVIANTLSLAEDPTVTNGVLSVEVESSKETGTKTFTVLVPDALPENIVSGKNILGVEGTAKKVTITGDYIPASGAEALFIHLSGLDTMPKAVYAIARSDVREFATEEIKPIYAASAMAYGTDQTVPTAGFACYNSSDDLSPSLRLAGRFSQAGDGYNFSSAGTNAKFAPVTYDWVAYYWED